jgi:hypothetical protein
LFERVAALVEAQSSKLQSSRSQPSDDSISRGLDAALAISLKAVSDCEREETAAQLTHSMVLVLIQAAHASHRLHILQRFALIALAGLSMSGSGRRMLLSDSSSSVASLMSVLSAGEVQTAALAALVLGNLALESVAVSALEQCAGSFAREVVSLLSCGQVSRPVSTVCCSVLTTVDDAG